MIRCPKCSTLNRDGSRFCNECGAPLQKTRLRCPKCGTLNPVGNIFCDHCHARLLPPEDFVPPAPEVKPTEETFPRVQGISLPTRLASPPEDAAAPEAPEMPDWLMGLLEPEKKEEEVLAVGSTFGADRFAAEEPPPSPGETTAASGDLPDWLLEIAADSEAPLDTAAAAPDVPEWMWALAVEEPPSGTEPEPASELPDWLSGLEDLAPAAAPKPAPEPQEELPDWLSGLEDLAPAAAPKPAPEPQEELPDWLSGLEDFAPAAAPKPAPEPQEKLPDWLGSLEDFTPAAAPKPAPEPQEELPDWLGSLELEDVEFPAATAPEPTPEPREELPDWLADMLEAESGASVSRPAAPPTALSPEQLSAWERPAPPVDERLFAGPTFGDEEDDTWPEQEVPSPKERSAATPELESAALPDWLKELGPRPDATAEILPEGLEQAEVPTWLAQLRPAGTGPLDTTRAPETPEGGEEIEGGLVRAEIPEWVQQYRPSTMTPGGVVSPLELVIAAPPESEGPLAGIGGVLPALPIVDAPELAAPMDDWTLPSSVVQQAQLWQELLERPHESTPSKPKALKQATWPVAVVRIVVALALTLVAVLSFSTEPLALPPEQAGVSPLYTAIEALPPGAEVLVAFEYGPAEVDEMQFIVEALFEHLLAREVRILAVSTFPEGPGLIEERFAWARERPDTLPENLLNLGFVPGGATGIAGILNHLDAETGPQLLVVIASRSDKLKAWTEQNAVVNSGRLLAGTPTLPLVVGASAVTGTQMRPYLETADITGWLQGFSGVAAYWQARGFPPREDISRRLDALLLTQWAAASFLLAGALFYLLAGKQRTG